MLDIMIVLLDGLSLGTFDVKELCFCDGSIDAIAYGNLEG